MMSIFSGLNEYRSLTFIVPRFSNGKSVPMECCSIYLLLPTIGLVSNIFGIIMATCLYEAVLHNVFKHLIKMISYSCITYWSSTICCLEFIYYFFLLINCLVIFWMNICSLFATLLKSTLLGKICSLEQI